MGTGVTQLTPVPKSGPTESSFRCHATPAHVARHAPVAMPPRDALPDAAQAAALPRGAVLRAALLHDESLPLVVLQRVAPRHDASRPLLDALQRVALPHDASLLLDVLQPAPSQHDATRSRDVLQHVT